MDRIETAIETIRNGGMVVVVDDECRENEGDLIVAAEKATPEIVTFMARQACGLICLALMPDQIDRLGLPMMTPPGGNDDNFGTAFTVSIEAAEGVTTGISAADRARTIKVASDPSSTSRSIKIPGHIFPLRARAGGVRERPGHTEASIELARLAGLTPAGVVCEIMDEDGTMMRLPSLRKYARHHNLPLISIAELIDYLNTQEQEEAMKRAPAAESLIEEVASSRLPTYWGEFRVVAFREKRSGNDHLALVLGEIEQERVPLVRIHSECLTGDVLGSLRCDCGPQLHQALRQIAEEGHGLLLYLRQEGRGIGLVNKLRAYALQEQGLDTVEANEHLGFPADARDYHVAVEMLKALNIPTIRLLTNNPQKLSALTAWGLDVVERVPLQIPATSENYRYLETKRRKLGHLLPNLPASPVAVEELQSNYMIYRSESR